MKVGIVGLGLIGGSLAKVYRENGHEVFAYDKNEEVLNTALNCGAADEELNKATYTGLDILYIALYPAAAIEYVRENAHLIDAETVVVDCCGVKKQVCDACFPIAREYGFTFVGGHPMAGTHKSGFRASRANLFQGASMIIVPEDVTDTDVIVKVKSLVLPAGFGRVTVTDADNHDRMIAFTSQMAHIVSNAYIKSPTAGSHKGFSAGSYKDLTRVAWLNEVMWSELFLDNKEHLLYELETLITSLTEYRDAISGDDRESLMALLAEGKKRKEEVDGVR